MLFTCVTFADGCFLAGRDLPGVVIAGSLLALFAAPRYLKSGITTIPQLLGERYDRPTKLWFSIAYIILYLFVQIPVILYSGSLVFENIFNLSGILGITKFQSIVILCILITIIGSIYAIFGGLKAVAVSDTINGVGLLIGGLMIPFLALNVLGHASGSESSVAIMDGVRYLIHNHADMLNSIAPAQSEAPAVPWPTVFLGLVFLGFQSWCTHQSFIQRVLAAENLKEAQKGALYCAFLKILGFMFLALPGVIAYAIFNIEGTQVSMMDDAYPALITRVVPQPVMGFFAAVMFGAILSSFNSVLNSVNTMFTMDIYKEFINKNASESKLVSVGKNIGIVFAIFSVIVGPMVYFFPAGLKTFSTRLLCWLACRFCPAYSAASSSTVCRSTARASSWCSTLSATAASCCCPRATRCSAAMRAASTTCTPYLSCGRSRCSSCTSCTAATRARALKFGCSRMSAR